MRISLVAAARPNFMKIGPVARALRGSCEAELRAAGTLADADYRRLRDALRRG